jgi:hypothetical protein
MPATDTHGHASGRGVAQDEDLVQTLRREAEGVRAANAITTVGRLLREYKIPMDSKSGPLDLETRLVHLVIALAETHPRHRKREKAGAKSKWSPWAWAALLIEIEHLLASGARTQTAAAKALATTEPWATLLRGNERPGESLRQEFVKASKRRETDPHFEEIFLLVQKFAPESTANRKRYTSNLLNKKKEPLPTTRIDVLLCQSSVKI